MGVYGALAAGCAALLVQASQAAHVRSDCGMCASHPRLPCLPALCLQRDPWHGTSDRPLHPRAGKLAAWLFEPLCPVSGPCGAAWAPLASSQAVFRPALASCPGALGRPRHGFTDLFAAGWAHQRPGQYTAVLLMARLPCVMLTVGHTMRLFWPAGRAHQWPGQLHS